MATDNEVLGGIFSDIDGTIVHYRPKLEGKLGYRYLGPVEPARTHELTGLAIEAFEHVESQRVIDHQRREIERLKAQLQAVADGGGPPAGTSAAAGTSDKFAGMDDAAITEMEARLAEERARMEADKSLAQEEKDKLAKKLAKREAEIAKERQARDDLAAQIAQLEEKVIVGGTNLLDEVEKQERELQQAQLEMERKAKEAERLQSMMEEKQEETVLEAQKFANLQEEVDVKTQKLKRLWSKFQAARTEITDLQEEHASDREALVAEIRRQNRELKLCRLIVNYFIPADDLDYVQSACSFDSEANDYVVRHQDYTGNNIERAALLNGGFQVGPVLPASPDARAAAARADGPTSPSAARFDSDKLLQYEAALQQHAIAPGDYNTGEENEAPVDVLEAVPNVYLSYSPGHPGPAAGQSSRIADDSARAKDKAKSKSKAKAKAKVKAKSKAKAKSTPEEEYPESRGFVVSQRRR